MLLKTETMSEKEIAQALNHFQKAIKKGIFTYEHADPIAENCYISSVGVIEGIYFPNSIIKSIKHPSYKAITLSKVGGVLGVVFELREDTKERLSERARIYFDDYIFESLEGLLYPVEFSRVRQHIERNRKAYNDDLNTLAKVQRVHKKNGDDFARLLDNFKGVYIEPSRSIMDGFIMSFKVGGFDGVYLYRDNDKRETDATADELEKLIAEKKQMLLQCIKECDEDLKHLERDFTKFEKITNELKKFLNSVNNRTAYREQLQSMTL